jgi:hypothetical protein
MTLHPKIKMIAEEFGESYEWIAGDESLFIRVRNHFIDIVKERLKTCKLEFVDAQKKTIILFFGFVHQRKTKRC